MREIYQGITDYIKDVRHDRRLRKIRRLCLWNQWKEGSVWHYIRQRKITRKVKKELAK